MAEIVGGHIVARYLKEAENIGAVLFIVRWSYRPDL